MRGDDERTKAFCCHVIPAFARMTCIGYDSVPQSESTWPLPFPQASRSTPRCIRASTRSSLAEALAFVAKLHRAFERATPGTAQGAHRPPGAHRCRRNAGLPRRDRGDVRDGDWKIAPLPKALECRRVEITGPVERKMIINAFNSGADSYMTDFEDSNSPNWFNQIQGQVNLKDAIRREISFTNEAGKSLQAQRHDRDAADPPARLASRREARDRRRPARFRRHLRFRARVLPQREGTDQRAASARSTTCRRWKTISRRVCGTTSS